MSFSSIARRRSSPTILAVALLFTASVASISTASAANAPPTISGQPAAEAIVGAQYSFQPTASDPEGKTLRFKISNKPSWASFSSSSGRLSGTPSAASVGDYPNISIRVSDGRNSTGLPAFSISVKASANSAPSISGSPASVVTAGQPYSFTPSANDADGDPLTFSVANKPTWATFSASTGKLSGTPTAANVGSYPSIAISVSDGKATTSLAAFSITVNAQPNTAPVISGSPAASVTDGSAYSFQPSASDANGDTLAFSITNKPTWAAFSTVTGLLSGTPGSANVGTYPSIVISVSDGKATTSLAAFSITVNAQPNTAPVISGSPATSVSAGTAYSFRPTASDANGDPLTFTMTNKPTWAMFDGATGQLSGTPTAAQVGTYANIVIAVSDGKTSTALPVFSIAVTQISSGSATLSWTAPTQNTDGSALTNLAGYRILYGTSQSALTQTLQIANPGLTTCVIENLSPGTYYFAVRAYSSTGGESADSTVASKVVQ